MMSWQHMTWNRFIYNWNTFILDPVNTYITIVEKAFAYWKVNILEKVYNVK